MANSKYFSDLKRGLARLRKQFLPASFNQVGVYKRPDLVRAQTRAYLLCSHAEVESFLEEWARSLLVLAREEWDKNQRVTLPLLNLLLSSGGQISFPESIQTGGGGNSGNAIADKVREAIQGHFKKIKENHGVKEANTLSLFLPLGVPEQAFTTTMLLNLSALGEHRGKYAHVAAKAVPSVLDPEAEFMRLELLQIDLLALDSQLCTFRKSIR